LVTYLLQYNSISGIIIHPMIQKKKGQKKKYEEPLHLRILDLDKVYKIIPKCQKKKNSILLNKN